MSDGNNDNMSANSRNQIPDNNDGSLDNDPNKGHQQPINGNMNSAITERLINNFLYQFSQNTNNNGNNMRGTEQAYNSNPAPINVGFNESFNTGNNMHSLFQQQKLQQQMMGNNSAYFGHNGVTVNHVLDPQAVLNMNWLQQTNGNMLEQQPSQPQLVQQQSLSSVQVPKSKLVQDLSLLTQQQINQISPILQVSGNGSLTSSQFKNETRTQKRVTKRKSLLKLGPKRPSSAYFFYCQAVRGGLQKEFPQMKVPEMQKKMGQDWREMSDEEKEPFKEKHQEAWKLYKIAKEEYESKLPPKKPSGPFVAYVIDQKERFLKKKDGKKLQLPEITAMCVEEWKNLDKETKLKYNLSFKEKIKLWKEAYEKLENNERANGSENLGNFL